MVLIFISTLLVSMVVMLMLSPKKASKKDVARKLAIITISNRGTDGVVPLELVEPASDESFGAVSIFLQRFRFAENLQTLLTLSGSKSSVGKFVATSLLTACISAAVIQMLTGLWPLAGIAFVAGAISRWLILKFKSGRRLRAMNTALPDAIDLLARALRAGHSVASAVEVVAEQSAEPLASEFGIVSQQQKCGVSFRDAVLALAGRIPLKDLHFLITAILVQKETGGDLTEVLDRTTYVIRDRIRIEGEIRTYTAQGRLTGWILAMLPVVMLMLLNIVTPGYSHLLFSDPLGQKLLYGSAILIVIGGFIISKIVNIQV